MVKRPLALIAGIGEGLGIDLAGQLASEGYDVCGISRSDRLKRSIAATVEDAGGAYEHRKCDLTVEKEVEAAIEPLAPRVEVAVHLAHALLIKPFDETTPSDFETVWRASCLSAVLVALELAPAMAHNGRGVIIVSGATASMRGGPQFSAFASAKFALRGFAQSLSREYSPKGVHVAHVVLDGLIAAPQTDLRFGPVASGRMDPADIAAAYLAIARQPPSAWSQEIDLRPFAEKH
jgi:NAD(P)-dependent dehydrogenase (short-subunit alcohol dehydrogenase family)